MTDGEVCALCGQPGTTLAGREFFGGSASDDEGQPIQLHHGELTQIIAWKHDLDDDDCKPIMTTCFRAWTVYGHRPDDDEDVEVDG